MAGRGMEKAQRWSSTGVGEGRVGLGWSMGCGERAVGNKPGKTRLQ